MRINVAAAAGLALFVPVLLHALSTQSPLAPERQDHQRPTVARDDAGEHAVQTPEQWARRRESILQGLQQATGTLPERAKLPPADVKVTEETRSEGFVRQTLTYVADTTGRVPAHLYLPEPREPGKRLPAIVALHQTSPLGKFDLAGGAGGQGNMAYAPQLARRGYVVICPDYPSFGDAADYDFAADPYDSGTMKGIVNHMRAVDVLAARADVDPDRIGAVGHSLGGHNAIFLGVFDPRIKVVVASCGWTPFHDYQAGNIAGWTSDRYMPRLRDVYGLDPDKVPFDFPELIAALAPRAFFSVSPTGDENFSAAGVKKGIAAATPVFELLEAKDKLQARYPEGGHDFTPEMREQAFAFVDQVLGNVPQQTGGAGDKPQAGGEEDFAAELPRIAPTEPADAIKTFQTLPGFHMELAASEPNVASPVALDFDENGRMFVCEMRDYSEQDKERLGTIRMLEDADGDGTFEKSTVFADDLSWPTALVCYEGGLFVGAAPDVYWLKDTDGDGKADERKVVFTGFNRSNVQGLLNSFHWGLDNRIHGATSTSGGNVRRPEQPEAEAINLSGRDFSFDPRTLELRPESGGAQHGMSFDDWGRKFVSSNSDHIQMVMIDDRYLAQNPNLAVASARESIAADGPQAEVFRVSPVEPWRIIRTKLRMSGAVPGIIEGGGRAAGYFTGATGVTIYRGDAFPPEYRGQAFIGDVGSNIVHRKVLEPHGVGFIARRVDEGKEFVASTDTWFRPAQFANAPDGTLYVIDVYREVIEHPASLPPIIKKHLDLTSGRDRGRIWRVAPDGFKRRPGPHLSDAPTDELVKLLEHRNGWHRDTAGRLLYQRQDKSAGPLLKQLSETSKMPEARMHALYALAGLGELSGATLGAALEDGSPRVREHAIRLLESESFPALGTLGEKHDRREALVRLAKDPDARVRYQLALTEGIHSKDDPAKILGELLGRAGDDRWMRAAVLALAGDHAAQVLATLAQDQTFGDSPEERDALTELSRQVGTRNQPDDVGGVLRIISAHRALAPPLLGGLSAGLSLAGTSVRNRLGNDAEAAQTLADVLADARHTAADDKAGPARRAEAARLLSIGTFAESKSVLAKAITDTQPQEVQLAALAALDRFNDPEIGPILIRAWPGMTPATRNAAANVIFARPERAAAFLDAVESGKIKAADVDRARLMALEKGDDPALAGRAKTLLAAAPSAARQKVFESYQPALALAGDAARGKLVFQKTCAACHRLGGEGQEIGPNLAAMQSRGAEAILLNVIDPNREVNPQYVDYVVQTASGRTTSGILASETAGGITLKRAGGETETIARADVKRMRSSGLSIMPEGLEQTLDPQAMADLIAYVLSAK